MYRVGDLLTVVEEMGSQCEPNRLKVSVGNLSNEEALMTTQDKLIRNKLGMLRLAEQLQNVSKACKILGVSRQHFYDVKRQFVQYGAEGLREKVRKVPAMPNKTRPVLEDQILSYSLLYPSYGYARVALCLRLQGVYVAPSRVRYVFQRHGLNRRYKRYLRLEQEAQKEGFALTDDQIELLSRFSDRFQSRHVESHHPGYLLCQDTFEVGYMKGVGRIYLQAVVDSYNSFGFAKLYTSKQAITAADMLNACVFPFYDTMGIPVLRILTDNGREYCGRKDEHPYELYLGIRGIRHTTTKVKSPLTNGFVERFNRTLLEEFFMVNFRKKWYESVQELQKDLDAYLFEYNFRRPHMGYRNNGVPPGQRIFTGDGMRRLQ
jgi:transposase InsO family protein